MGAAQQSAAAAARAESGARARRAAAGASPARLPDQRAGRHPGGVAVHPPRLREGLGPTRRSGQRGGTAAGPRARPGPDHERGPTAPQAAPTDPAHVPAGATRRLRQELRRTDRGGARPMARRRGARHPPGHGRADPRHRRPDRPRRGTRRRDHGHHPHLPGTRPGDRAPQHHALGSGAQPASRPVQPAPEHLDPRRGHGDLPADRGPPSSRPAGDGPAQPAAGRPRPGHRRTDAGQAGARRGADPAAARPRDDRERADLDAVPAGEASGGAGPATRGTGLSRRPRDRRRPAPTAVHGRRGPRGHAPVSAGLDDDPPPERGAHDRRIPAAGRGHPADVPVGGAARRALVARTRRVPTATLAHLGRGPAPLRVLPVRRRPAPVHRQRLRDHRGHAGAGNHPQPLATAYTRGHPTGSPAGPGNAAPTRQCHAVHPRS